MTENLQNFFEKYLEKESFFLDKTVLQSSHIPSEIEHRDEQINQLANIMAPSLRGEKTSNVFIYGKTGTGKTMVAKHVATNITEVAKNKNLPIKICYLNCKLKKIADTEYRLIAQLARFFGKEIPITGLPTDEVYKLFFSTIDKEKQNITLILDELDQLVKKTGDEIIYNLTRINSELQNAQISIVGISNDLMFANNLDPRVKSSLSEEEILFPPYNALQIQSILKKRAKKAFKPKTLEEGVVAKCAAYAAREHGDARRALELLRVAGELAERSAQDKVDLRKIDEAQDKIEKDKLVEIVKTQPKQFQIILHSILTIASKKGTFIFTGEIYDHYKKNCLAVGLRPLTQRRVSDVIAELDMLGLINARVVSKGRFGRTREISLAIPPSLEEKTLRLLKEEIGL